VGDEGGVTVSLDAYQLSYNGVLIGSGADCAGYLTQADGLRGLPDIRTGDTPRPGDQGLLAGADFAGARTITLDVECTDNALGTKVENLAAIEGAFVHSTSTPSPLSFLLDDGSQRRIYCRTRKRATLVDVPYAGGVAKVALQLVADDPRIYDDEESTADTGLPEVVGGLTWPLSWPLSWGGATGTGGTITATNAGTFPTRPIATISGPCTNPQVENVTAGQTLSTIITLGSTDLLVIDFDAHTIILNGTGNRYNALVPASAPWWELAPGDNEIRFESDDVSTTDATLTLAWRSAWI
jgi:hypothetical protein